MVTETYKKIGTTWVIGAATSLVGYLVAGGHVPADLAPVLQSDLTKWALGGAAVLFASVREIRGSLREEAKAKLPETASPTAIEIKMAELGWAHVLWAARGGDDPRYEELRAEALKHAGEVADLKAAVAALTADVADLRGAGVGPLVSQSILKQA